MATTSRPALINHCKRGDIIAWAERRVYRHITQTATETTTYIIGIVKSVGRDGLVKTADTGMGIAAVDHTIESAAVRGEQIDLDKARAWLASDANYPRAGSTPLRSMDDVRGVVRGWLKEG